MIEKKINIKLIIENCRKGDRKSQKKLYEYFFGYGMNIALRYTKNKEEAQEILNDAFLKAFVNLDKYDDELAFHPWFRKIIINTSIDYHRSSKSLIKFEEMGSEKEPMIDPFPLPILSPDEDVLPIVQQLSPAYRLVFNLYVMEGYKHHEIAALLNISVSTSKTNLLRAKAKLQELLFKKKELLI